MTFTQISEEVETPAAFEPQALGVGQVVLDGFRFSVARAADAPVPTIVFDGRDLDLEASRDEVLAWLEEPRRLVVALRPDLGMKSVVVMRPVPDRALRVHFFQGTVTGDIDASVRTCVNSAGAAMAVATKRWHMSQVAPAVIMDGRSYGFEEAA